MIIPSENERELKEIPDNVKEKLTIHPVKWMDEVLELALERMPEPRLPDDITQPVAEAVVELQTDAEQSVNPH